MMGFRVHTLTVAFSSRSDDAQINMIIRQVIHYPTALQRGPQRSIAAVVHFAPVTSDLMTHCSGYKEF